MVTKKRETMKNLINHGWLGSNIGRSGRRVKGLVFLQILIFLMLGNSVLEAQWSSQNFRKGDALRLTVWQPWRVGDNKNQSIDISGDYIIDSRGDVFFPLIGDISVVSHNSTSLGEVLTEKYSEYIQDPIIVVEPLIRVTLLGAFRRPGTYLIAPDASLWELVDLAGGPEDNSDLKKMYVERGGRIVKKNILGAFERAYTLTELGIRSGDQVLVPAKNPFRLRDAFEILRFGISLINLYLLVDRL